MIGFIPTLSMFIGVALIVASAVGLAVGRVRIASGGDARHVNSLVGAALFGLPGWWLVWGQLRRDQQVLRANWSGLTNARALILDRAVRDGRL